MKNIKSDSLYRLVDTLSPKERSHFVKHLRQHKTKSDSKALELFRLVVLNVKGKIENYMEASRHSINPKSLPTVKHLLYNSLLSKLGSSYERTVRAEVSHMIDTISVLINRGLLQEALKLSRKAQKAARENHLHNLYLEHSMIYRRLIRQFATKNIPEQLAETQKQTKQAVQWINEEVMLFNLYEDLYIQKRLNKHKEIAQNIKKIDDLELREPETFEAKMYFHLAHRLKYNHQKRYGEELTHSRLVAKNFDKHPLLLMDNLPRYLRTINNLINSCFRTGNIAEAKEHIEKMKAISSNNFYQKAQLKSLIISSEIIYHFLTGQIQKICDESDAYFEEIEQHQRFIPYERLLEIYYNIAVSFFYSGHYEKTQEWLNHCLSQRRNIEFKEKNINNKVGHTTEARAITLRLIVFYELGHVKLLKSFVPAAVQSFSLSKHKYFRAFNKIVVFLQHIHQPENLSERAQTLIAELKEEVMMDEFIYWLKKWLG